MLRNWTDMVAAIIVVCLITACESEFVPKPKGWNRIDLPAHEYRSLEGDYPYTFEYSKHANAYDDTTGITEPYWIQVDYPEMGAELAISYKAINGNLDRFYEIINDAHKLTAKHQVKAYSIEQSMLVTDKGQTAMLFELSGEVPSQVQFYVTDSTQHFLRGALYFKTATSNDSLGPVIRYIREDVVRMLNTLEWKEGHAPPLP